MSEAPTIAVLAGGLATRLGPITKQVPKALLEVHGRPFLEWQLNLFAEQGIRDVVLCVGHHGDQIEAWVERHAPAEMRVRLSWDGERQLGTGGALLKALPLLGDRFLVTYGDSYLHCDYLAIARHFVALQSASRGEPRPLGLMTVYKNDNKFDASNVVFRDGVIVRYDKVEGSPEMQYIDWGLGMLTAEAVRPFARDEPLDLAHIYGSLVRDRRLVGLEMSERFYEVGSLAGIEEFSKHVSAGVQSSAAHSARSSVENE